MRRRTPEAATSARSLLARERLHHARASALRTHQSWGGVTQHSPHPSPRPAHAELRAIAQVRQHTASPTTLTSESAAPTAALASMAMTWTDDAGFKLKPKPKPATLPGRPGPRSRPRVCCC